MIGRCFTDILTSFWFACCSELKTDIKLLLECLDYQKEDGGTTKQTFMTLAAMLQGTGVCNWFAGVVQCRRDRLCK